jgi:3-demethoxyubiquinol 3-hydroxylase
MKLFDVIVVGAGIVGSTAALCLSRAGYRVALVEAHEAKSWSKDTPDLRVVALAPDNQSLFESLDVWPLIASRRTQAYTDMRVWDAGAGNPLHLSAAQRGHQRLGFIIENANIVDALWTAIQKNGAITCFCPNKLDVIEQHDNYVNVRLLSGENLKASLLIGADGASSKVRELVDVKLDAKAYRQRGVVAYVSTELPHQNTAWQRFLATGPLAFLPFCDGRSSVVWTLPDSEAERLLQCDETSFCDELTRAFDARLGHVLEVSARASFPLQRQLSKEMLVGNVALIGDAAHTVHPLAGQGVNLGLRDALTLVAALGEVNVAQTSSRQKNHLTVSQHKLQRWSRSRLSENAVAAYSFEAINRVFSNDALLPTLLRGHAFGIANAVPPIRNFLLRQADGR